MRLSATILLLLYLFAAEAIEVNVPQTPLWATPNSNGLAFELFNAIDQQFNETKPQYSTSSLPLVRAINDYVSGKSDCFMGADEVIFKGFYKMDIISSTPIKESAVLAFTLPGSPPISSFDDLKGQVAGVPFGGDIAKTILEQYGIESLKGHSFSQLLTLLKRRRISAIVAPDLEQYNHPQLRFDPDFAIFRYTDRLHCHPSEKNQQLIQHFNQGLERLSKNGELQSLFTQAVAR